ncbi:glutamine cyclotransferase [Achromobacter xylosoxidans]
MKSAPAQIVREYGPFPGVTDVHGVSHDARRVWFATGDSLQSMDPASGKIVSIIKMTARAGTAYDGQHLYQLAGPSIQKVDPRSGEILATLPAPAEGCSGMAWAEGALWVAHYRERKIHKIDPATGKILRTIASDRYVTGVTWTNGGLWHGTWENDESELRRVSPETGEVQESLLMPPGVYVSGLEAGDGVFYCGGSTSGRIRAVRQPEPASESR